MEESSDTSQENLSTSHLKSEISKPIPSEKSPIHSSKIGYGTLKVPVTSQPQHSRFASKFYIRCFYVRYSFMYLHCR